MKNKLTLLFLMFILLLGSVNLKANNSGLQFKRIKLASTELRFIFCSPFIYKEFGMITEKRKAYNKVYNKAYRKINPEKCKVYRKSWQKANSEKMKVSRKKWLSANPEKAKACNKAWYEANREKERARRKAWYQANREKMLVRYKANNKAWREANFERIKAYNKAYCEANPEKVKSWEKARNPEKEKARKKAWREAHPEYLKAYREANSERVKAWEKSWRETNPAICMMRKLVGRAYKGQIKPASSLEIIGLSAIEFQFYIGSKFTEGMTHENHGEWHIDHIKPLASFDLTDPEQRKASCHYTNLQPLWATTREINGVVYLGNINKGAKI